MAEHIKIVIDAVDNATKPLSKVSASMSGLQKAGAQLKLGFTELNSMFSMAAQAGRIVGQAFDQTVGATVDYARSVMDLSISLGIASEEASYLYQIADDLKIPVTNLEMAFKQAVKNGIQPNVENIKELAAEYQSMKDPVERAQYAMKIFGMRAGPEMQKLLEATPEAIDAMAKSAEAAGLIMSGESITAAREYEIALDELSDAAQGAKISIGNELIPAVTDFLRLLTSPDADHAASFINEVFKGTFIESPISKAAREATGTVDDMNEKLRESAEVLPKVGDGMDILADATNNAADAMKNYTRELLFNIASEGLGEAAALALAQSMGLVDQATVTATTKVNEYQAMLDSGRISLATYNALVNGMADAIDRLQSKEIDVTVNTYENSYKNVIPGHNTNATSNATVKDFASGANFVVPPGYPNDSYGPIYVESGEHVKITPANEVAKDMRTFNFNYSGNASAQQIRQSYEMARLLG